MVIYTTASSPCLMIDMIELEITMASAMELALSHSSVRRCVGPSAPQVSLSTSSGLGRCGMIGVGYFPILSIIL